MAISIRPMVPACMGMLSILAIGIAMAQQPSKTPRGLERAEQAIDRAQERVQQAQERVGQRQTVLRPVQPAMNNDRIIATWLVQLNHGEVELGKFAAERAHSDKVKEFAQQMVEDHGKSLDQLLTIAPDALARGREPGAQQPAAGAPFQPPAPAPALPPAGQQARDVRAGQPIEGGAANRGFDFQEAHRRIAAACLASAKRDLGELEGKDFDFCYMGMMLGKHQGAIDTQDVLREYASPELQKLIDDQAEVTSDHLSHASRIMNTLLGRTDKQERTEN